jgi:hypothetical protein
MDTLVAQYSRPMFEKENNHEEDQMDLYNPAPSMSLKFAMPPIAQVRFLSCTYCMMQSFKKLHFHVRIVC